MSTLRVWDALRYGSKFVGLLLAVVIVVGGFVAGGLYLSADAINLADPSLNALQETSVFIGLILLAVGVVLGAVGWNALAYKFVTDAVGAALTLRDVGDPTTAVETESESSTDVDEPTDADDSTEPTGSANGPEAAAANTGASTAESDSMSTEDSSRQADVDEVEHATRAGEPVGEEPTTDKTADPPEWTPPDPSEFESAGTAETDETDPATEQWVDETADVDMTGNEASSTEPVNDETVVDSAAGSDGTRSTDPSTETRSSSQPDPEEIDEDVTLADEGVDSFSTASDEDPLSDRLPGDDS